MYRAFIMHDMVITWSERKHIPSGSSNESHDNNSTTWSSVPITSRFDALRTIEDDNHSTKAKHKVSPKRKTPVPLRPRHRCRRQGSCNGHRCWEFCRPWGGAISQWKASSTRRVTDSLDATPAKWNFQEHTLQWRHSHRGWDEQHRITHNRRSHKCVKTNYWHCSA